MKLACCFCGGCIWWTSDCFCRCDSCGLECVLVVQCKLCDKDHILPKSKPFPRFCGECAEAFEFEGGAAGIICQDRQCRQESALSKDWCIPRFCGQCRQPFASGPLSRSSSRGSGVSLNITSPVGNPLRSSLGNTPASLNVTRRGAEEDSALSADPSFDGASRLDASLHSGSGVKVNIKSHGGHVETDSFAGLHVPQTNEATSAVSGEHPYVSSSETASFVIISSSADDYSARMTMDMGGLQTNSAMPHIDHQSHRAVELPSHPTMALPNDSAPDSFEIIDDLEGASSLTVPGRQSLSPYADLSISRELSLPLTSLPHVDGHHAPASASATLGSASLILLPQNSGEHQGAAVAHKSPEQCEDRSVPPCSSDNNLPSTEVNYQPLLELPDDIPKQQNMSASNLPFPPAFDQSADQASLADTNQGPCTEDLQRPCNGTNRISEGDGHPAGGESPCDGTNGISDGDGHPAGGESPCDGTNRISDGDGHPRGGGGGGGTDKRRHGSAERRSASDADQKAPCGADLRPDDKTNLNSATLAVPIANDSEDSCTSGQGLAELPTLKTRSLTDGHLPKAQPKPAVTSDANGNAASQKKSKPSAKKRRQRAKVLSDLPARKEAGVSGGKSSGSTNLAAEELSTDITQSVLRANEADSSGVEYESAHSDIDADGSSVDAPLPAAIAAASNGAQQGYTSGKISSSRAPPSGSTGGMADIAEPHDMAAGIESNAFGVQGKAAGPQGNAAGQQNDPALRQCNAAGQQNDPAGRQGNATGQQNDPAAPQANADGQQSDPAERQSAAEASEGKNTRSSKHPKGRGPTNATHGLGQQDDPWITHMHDVIEVTFNVVISQRYCFDEKRDVPKIILRGYGLNRKPTFLSLVKERLISDVHGWTAKILIPRDIFRRQLPLEYKYGILYSSIKSLFERIRKPSSSGNSDYRSLHIPSEKLNTPSFCQYDFVMMPEEYTASHKGNKSQTPMSLAGKQMKEDAHFGLMCMLPCVSFCLAEIRMSAEDVIQSYYDVLSCLQNGAMFFLDDIQSKVDFAEVRKAVESYLASQAEKHSKLYVPEHLLKTDSRLCFPGQDPLVPGLVLLYLCYNHSAFTYHSADILTSFVASEVTMSGKGIEGIRHLLKKHFFVGDRLLQCLYVLRCAMIMTAETGQPQWLCGLPVYHAIFEQSYNALSLDDHFSTEWWGLDKDFEQCLRAFKSSVQHFDLRLWYSRLSHVLKQNFRCARAFIAALPKEHLLSALDLQLDLPLEGYVAAIFHCDVWPVTGLSIEETVTALGRLAGIVGKLIASEVLGSTDSRRMHLHTGYSILCESAGPSLHQVKLQYWDYVVALSKLMAACHVASAGTHAERLREHVAGNPTSFIDDVQDWMRRELSTFCMMDGGLSAPRFVWEPELKMWEMLLEITWDEEDVNRHWVQSLSGVLHSRVEKLSDSAKVDLYCLNIFKSPVMIEEFYSAAAKAAGSVEWTRPDAKKYYRNKDSMSKFGHMLSLALSGAWPQSFPNTQENLHFAFTWPSFCTVLDLECHNGEALLPAARSKIDAFVSLLKGIAAQLDKGTIKFVELADLIKNKDAFLKLCQALQQKPSLQADMAGAVQCLAVREREKAQFDEIRGSLEIFLSLCRVLNAVQISDLAKKLEDDIGEKQTCSLWVPHDPKAVSSAKLLDCRYFPLARMHLNPEILGCMNRVHKSLLFGSFWKAAGINNAARMQKVGQTAEYAMDDVVKYVWLEANTAYCNFRDRLQTGSATFSDGDYFLNVISSNDQKSIANEIAHVIDNPADRAAVVKRLFQYSQLCHYHEGAKVMQSLKEKFGLTGSFSDLEILIRLDKDKSRKLTDVTDKLIDSGNKLKVLNTKKTLDCLKAFLDCKELISWVKECIKDPKEINVFVDLASIAAGEGAKEQTQVSGLLASITGYSQLIYNLPITAGLDVFLSRCDSLWKSLHDNPNLAAQLRETNAILEWFKGIQESYGSVELTSVQQATAINNSGIYEIGLQCQLKPGQKLELADMLRVHLVNKKGTASQAQPEKRSSYTYGQLCDLQNKLMLVAGQPEKEKTKQVDRFVEMLRSVLRLGNAYIEVHEAGSIWFDHFKVEVRCANEEDHIQVTGGLAGHPVSIGSDCPRNASARILSDIADMVENCCKDWIQHVSEQRKSFHQLNFFTTKQVTFLRRELGGFAQLPHSCDNKVYPVLAMLSHCTQRDLETAIKQAETDMTSLRATSAAQDTGTTPTDDRTLLTLVEQVYSAWRSFLDGASTSVHDFLSVKHLGYVLKALEAISHAKEPARMQPPLGLRRGQPHLIVCPERSAYAATLSLYMKNKTHQMPTRNEVLVCSDLTTMEEVDLFIERAFVDDRSLYCMTHAHRLSYEICGHVEKKIDDFMPSKKDSFIAFICAEEFEDRSRIVTALERFRAKNFHIEDAAELKAYVLKNLKSASDKYSLDAEQSLARVVYSGRAGMGKTLYVRRVDEKLQRQVTPELQGVKAPLLTIPLVHQKVDVDGVLKKLLRDECEPKARRRRVIHINIAQEASDGVDELLFNLLLLRSICQKDGYVWQCSHHDYYLIETTHAKAAVASRKTVPQSVVELLPFVECVSPECCRQLYADPQRSNPAVLLMDDLEFKSEKWQRAYQYLVRLDQSASFFDVNPQKAEGTKMKMLDTLIRHCGLADPSWSELHHFVLFLSSQLKNCEESSFCCGESEDELPGFLTFVVKFLLQMSKDFATRSLYISEESPEAYCAKEFNEDILKGMTMKRSWENSHHPYLFFNPDRTTMTFLGFYFDRRTGNIFLPGTRTVLQEGVIQKDLYDALERNGVAMSEDFETKSRDEKIRKLCEVMGNSSPADPDPSYELTMDNVKKMLAIHMRFRCGIPVVMMGETGCGKTRLVRFMCSLQIPKKLGVTNLVLMKIHGGVTREHVKEKVYEAYNLAKRNQQKYSHADTVLFFDEANTTDAIGLIKEVMCDSSIDGESLDPAVRLRIVAAVNPYRKHSKEMIDRLELAGLGYHVKASATTDVLGSIPMRHLVYRVKPLPHSMLPLVWDFGQIRPADEEKYMVHMVGKHVDKMKLSDSTGQLKASIAMVLAKCQDFMRRLKGECSFVSLRDIERVLAVMQWFYNKRKLLRRDAAGPGQLDDVTWSLVLALAVCYHACLQPQSRPLLIRQVAAFFKMPLVLPRGEKQILEEIEACQSLLISSLPDIPENISLNHALKENVFMMVVCIELRIPLFLVGKPGSSKSLAKTVVAEAMQGENSKRDESVFKHLKQAQLISFQCSPLATPEGIVNTFKQCAGFQQKRNLEAFVSVVVLDEIGLAEDSKLMPLKTLHPLLEDGCEGSETPEPYMKCGFIGISNWALDPAKMNRGILVQRGVPARKELADTAKGICQFAQQGFSALSPIINSLLTAYLKLFDGTVDHQEFFGLRDFYSLMKMLAYFASKNNDLPNPYQFRHAVLRNFGGRDDMNVVKLFEQRLGKHMSVTNVSNDQRDPPCDTIGLIDSALSGAYTRDGGESRYLLILAENYAAVNLVLTKLQIPDSCIIFGSNFPKDLDYIQVCRNINRIKVRMETGKTVILLNLESLYESLYDALNQYYSSWGGQRFVDLGLGTHRVKCRVHSGFRLIIIARKQDVYDKFPIPLLNRLEKHYVAMESLLSTDQKAAVKKLQQWAEDFVQTKASLSDLEQNRAKAVEQLCSRAFVGYSADAAASIVMQVTKKLSDSRTHCSPEQLFEDAKSRLLLSATPDAVIRAKLSSLFGEYERIHSLYFEQQQHGSLSSFLVDHIKNHTNDDLFCQVTTYYTLLSHDDVNMMKADLSKHVSPDNIHVIDALQAVQTEQQFSQEISKFFAADDKSKMSAAGTAAQKRSSVLVVQCEAGHNYMELIECARYIIIREYNDAITVPPGSLPCNEKDYQSAPKAAAAPVPAWRHHVVIVVQLGHKATFQGFHGGKWLCVHIDDLRPEKRSLPSLSASHNHTIGQLFKSALAAADNHGGMVPASGSPEEANNVLGLRNVSARPRDAPRETTFDVLELLRQCMHDAACRVRDSDDFPERSVDRLSLLNSLFSSSGENEEFQRLFADQLVQLLVHVEGKGSTSAKPNWLSEEAAALSRIEKQSTFRRSFSDCIERKIVPVYATIIAYIDTNCNLDLLCEARSMTQSKKWTKILWLGMLRDSDLQDSMACTVNDLASAVEKVKVPVIGKSATGRGFRSKFPFSWLWKKHIDTLMAARELQHQDVTEDLLLRDGTPKCGILSGLSDDQMSEAVSCYLHDFAYLACRCMSETDHQIVLHCLHNQMVQQKLTTIVGVHICFKQLQSRLKLLERSLILIPDKIKDNAMAQLEKMDLEGGPEMVLDVVLLHTHLMEIADDPKAQQWCTRVRHMHADVEQILASESTHPEGSKSLALIKDCRSLWNRVVSARLFFDYVVAPSSPWLMTFQIKKLFDLTDIKDLMQNLVTCSDFKQLKAVLCIEEFLKRCLQKIWKDMCGKNNQSYEAYRGCLEAFFKHVFSDLVFHESKLPEEELTAHILSLVTREDARAYGRHKETAGACLDLLSDAAVFDLSPAVRSYLLLQLLRFSKPMVNGGCISNYFKLTVSPRRKDNRQADFEMCILVIECCEDYMSASKKAAQFALEWLNTSGPRKQMFSSTELTSERLNTVAALRLSLVIGCDLIYKQLQAKTELPQSDGANNVIEAMLKFCCWADQEEGCKWPLKFVTRQMLHKHGLSSILAVLDVPRLLNILPPGFYRNATAGLFFDPYHAGAACSVGYVDCRSAICKSLTAGKDDALAKWYQSCKESALTKRTLMLWALCFEAAKRKLQETSAISVQGVAAVEAYMVKLWPQAKDLCGRVLRNWLPGKQNTSMSRLPEASWVALLVLRLWAVLLSQEPQSASLLSPLQSVLAAPATMKNAFFPTTMPRAKDQIGARSRTQTVCPQGHIVEDKTVQCLRCSAAAANSHADSSKTKTSLPSDRENYSWGHTLGAATTGRISGADSYAIQQTVTPLAQGVARLFLHITLYVSAVTNDVRQMIMLIHSAQSADTVRDFLWDHVLGDLEELRVLLNRSRDDCLIFVHSLVADLLNVEKFKGRYDWSSVKGCHHWEVELQRLLVAPAVQNLSTRMTSDLRTILSDPSSAAGAELAQLLDEDSDNAPADLGSLISSAAVWHYRESPTIQHFMAQLEMHLCWSETEAPGFFAALLLLFRNHTQLAAVRHLPSIVSLTRLLKLEYGGRLSAAAANKLTIGDFDKKYGRSSTRDPMGDIQAFICAWNVVRTHLPSHEFWCGSKLLQLPDEICRSEMSLNSPLGMLLAGEHGLGLCPLALVTYLANLQNRFLAAYCDAYQERLQPEIPLSDADEAHLVAFDSERDLLPIVLVHRSYSLSPSRRKPIGYDFDGIQRQVIDQFIRHKRPLSLEHHNASLLIPSFHFHEYFTTGEEMEALSMRLPQVALSAAIKTQIVKDYRGDLACLTDSLVLIDKVVAFLVTSQALSNAKLQSHLRDTLQMRNVILHHTVVENCDLTHIKSLWLLLCLEKTKVLFEQHSEDCFDNVDKRYMEPLPSPVSGDQLRVVLKSLERDTAVLQVLDLLHEFILFKLTAPAHRSAADQSTFRTDDRLFGVLREYAEAGLEGRECYEGTDGSVLKYMDEHCGESILLRHATSTWLEMLTFSRGVE